MTESEMVGWHHRLNGDEFEQAPGDGDGWDHQLNGQEFEQAPGVGDGQGSLSWCGPWGCKESDTTERLN